MDSAVPDGWRLAWAHLPGCQVGETCWPSQTITIDPRIPTVAKRCTLTHETIHVERGPSPAVAYDTAEELAVQKATARRLIDIRTLGEALAESTDHLGHVADLLDVTPAVLATRLRWLHPAERAFLRRRLEHHDPQPETAAGCCPHPRLVCAECEYGPVCPSADPARPARDR